MIVSYSEVDVFHNPLSCGIWFFSVTGVIVVCAVCVGIVSLLVILGVMRIRNAQRHHQDVNMDDKQEMEWDNSALTITVNPMDQEVWPLSHSLDTFDNINLIISALHN